MASGNRSGMTTTDDATDEGTDVRWTDARVRWPEDAVVSPEGVTTGGKAGEDEGGGNGDGDEAAPPFDPFADPDPRRVFPLRFVRKKEATATASEARIEEPAGDATSKQKDDPSPSDDDDDESIRLEIHGYKPDADRVWESTGLTLWKASTRLCDYMVRHAERLRGQRVLELGAGLGLNGVLAHRLGAASVVITDGDSDALVELRKNVLANRIETGGEGTLSAAQLIWGRDSSMAFLARAAATSASSASSVSSRFSIVVASDVIYAAVVIDPLWETVRTLLKRPGGEFWMAFAVRKVPVTIDFVLQKAREHGFRHELVDEQDDGGGEDDEQGVEGNPETGPVFIYVFRWDVAATPGAPGS